MKRVSSWPLITGRQISTLFGDDTDVMRKKINIIAIEDDLTSAPPENIHFEDALTSEPAAKKFKRITHNDPQQAFSFVSLSQMLSTPEDAIKFCEKYKLLHSTSPVCTNPRCLARSLNRHGSKRATDGYIYRCTRCTRTQSIRNGTWFARIHMSLAEAILFIYLWAHGTSNISIGTMLNIGALAIIDYKNFLRDLCCIWENQLEPIGGPDKIVECDESILCKRKYRSPIWMFGCICRQTGEFRVEINEGRSTKALQTFITKHIAPGTIIFTDQLRPYTSIRKLGMDYAHRVNPAHGMQNIEGLWGRMKHTLKFMRGTTSSDLLPSYLAEATWRASNGSNGEQWFFAMLKLIAHNYVCR